MDFTVMEEGRRSSSRNGVFLELGYDTAHEYLYRKYLNICPANIWIFVKLIFEYVSRKQLTVSPMEETGDITLLGEVTFRHSD